jgi:F-type H+-transporting ATPase subunit alpha
MAVREQDVLLEDITQFLRQQIETFEAPVEAIDVGTVVEVGDGIARISGLVGAMASEHVEFETGVSGGFMEVYPDKVIVLAIPRNMPRR